MSFWRQLTRGGRTLINGPAADRDADDEVQHYFEEAAAEFVAQGMSPEDARRAARARWGNAAAIRDEVRAFGWERLVGTFLADVRYGWRGLRGSPGFTIVSVLTLALGVGASTAIVSAINPILFAPLPYPQSSRILAILEGGRRTAGTFAMYRNFQTRAHSFAAVAVMRPWQPTITGVDRPERLDGQRVTADYFRVLGVAPIAGRDFTAAEDRFRGPRVVILSDALWRRRFGSDPAIVGRAIQLDDDFYTVVGVMPRSFENVLAPTAGVWTTLQYDPLLPPQGREWGHHLATIARLAFGISLAEASRDANAVGRALLEERRPETYDPRTQFSVVSLHDALVGGVKPALWAIIGAVLLVLAIACVNVMNLLLARGAQRGGEFALRAALGAGRARLVRQLLTESLLLAATGGAVGMGMAAAGVRALGAMMPSELPRAGSVHVDSTMLLVGMAITTLVGLVFGTVPALLVAGRNPQRSLQEASRRTTGGHRRARRLLVVAEVALALVVLVATGLLLRSLNRLFAVPVGFDAGGLLTLQVQLVGHRYDRRDAAYRFFDEALAAVRRVPGVRAAGFTSQLPLSGDHDAYGAHFEAGRDEPAETIGVFRYAVSGGYLDAAGIPLLRGRSIDERDREGMPPVAVISESLARGRFHGLDPIGGRLTLGAGVSYTIVGVVGDVRQLSLALSDCDAVYISGRQSWFTDRVMSLVVRARGDAVPLVDAIERAIWSVDKDQPIVRVSTMQDLLDASAAERRFALIAFEAFGVAALLLAGIGIYGILAASVIERTREIGVRSALGASRADIVRLVVAQGMRLTGAGAAIGLICAVLASRALITLLFGVSRLDPATYAGVVALLLVVAGAACWMPAWRAARIDPSITLRFE